MEGGSWTRFRVFDVSCDAIVLDWSEKTRCIGGMKMNEFLYGGRDKSGVLGI